MPANPLYMFMLLCRVYHGYIWPVVLRGILFFLPLGGMSLYSFSLPSFFFFFCCSSKVVLPPPPLPHDPNQVENNGGKMPTTTTTHSRIPIECNDLAVSLVQAILRGSGSHRYFEIEYSYHIACNAPFPNS